MSQGVLIDECSTLYKRTQVSMCRTYRPGLCLEHRTLRLPPRDMNYRRHNHKLKMPNVAPPSIDPRPGPMLINERELRT